MRSIKKRIMCALLATGVMLTNVFADTNDFIVSAEEKINVIADWKFDSNNIESGSIADKNLVIKDVSGNGNSLRLNTYGNADDYSKYISFSDDKMYDATNGSIVISGDNSTRVGADLITVDNAPINKEEFENGYTIEFIYQLPSDWTVADKWMSLLSRQGHSESMDEPELGTMNVAVSNCKEIQFLTANKDDNHEMQSASWSVSMDKGGVWYHIAIVSDNESIRTFVNGAEAFRDYIGDDMVGLYADPNDGRFRIGSSWWKEGESTIDKFARGNYQQIRISEGALDKKDWLISNPESYVGEYGTNDEFFLRDNNNYNMVFIPDTQNTIKFRGNVMDTAMDWLVENADDANIVSVTHLGDVVENGNNEDQWNTTALFNKLPRAGVRLLMQPGNHDWPEYYDKYFGASSEYGSLTEKYVVRTSPSGRSTYMINEAGSYKYMTLAIDYHSYDTDLAWVEEILSSTNMPTIITSHDLQNCSDTAPSDIKLSDKGKQVWDVVKKYNQVFMMIGGHSHGAGDEILINDKGNEVISILADYQFSHNGGNALFKFAEFDETLNKIYLSTFSPYAATLSDEERTFFDVNYLTGAGNYSEFDINFAERFAGMDKSNALTESKKQLVSLLEKIEKLNSNEYIESTWAKLQIVIEKANGVVADENALEAEVVDTYKELVKAYLDIRLKPSKEKLEELINKVESLDSSKYTEESWSNLQDKLNKAKSVFANLEATSSEIQFAENQLNKALNELVAKVENDSNTEDNDDKEEGNGNNGEEEDKNNSQNNGSNISQGSSNNSNSSNSSATKLPQTGNEVGVIATTLGFILTGAGIILRRKK